MKKKLISLMLVITLLGSMLVTGCGKSSDDGESEKADTTTETKVEDEASGPSIEEQVLIEAEGVKLTATDFIIEEGNAVLLVTLENNSEKKVSVDVKECLLNGYYVVPDAWIGAEAGETAERMMIIDKFDLEQAKIEELAEIQFDLTLVDDVALEKGYMEGKNDSEVMEEAAISKAENVTIRTSMADSYTQVYDDSGDVIYDKNNIKVVFKGFANYRSKYAFEEDPDDQVAVLYVENNTDGRLVQLGCHVYETEINGKLIEVQSTDGTVYSGQRRICTIRCAGSVLKSNEIEAIEKMETTLAILTCDEKVFRNENNLVEDSKTFEEKIVLDSK